MDPPSILVDQFTTTMSVIHKALVNLGQRIDSQHSKQVVLEGTPYDLVHHHLHLLDTNSIDLTYYFTRSDHYCSIHHRSSYCH